MPMTRETKADTMSTMSVASLNEPRKMLSHDSGGVSATCRQPTGHTGGMISAFTTPAATWREFNVTSM
jgi:hypothetical protein